MEMNMCDIGYFKMSLGVYSARDGSERNTAAQRKAAGELITGGWQREERGEMEEGIDGE